MRWFKQPPSIGRLLVCSLIALSAADSVHAKGGRPLDLEKLTAPEARALMESG